MLLIHPKFSPITAIQLSNCFNVTMLKTEDGQIHEQFPSFPATELGIKPVSL